MTDHLNYKLMNKTDRIAERLNDNQYIHSKQARALLMQKLMEGRDMGDMDKQKQMKLLGLEKREEETIRM